MIVTAVYAAVLALFYVVLGIRIFLLWRRHGIAVGDGNDAGLRREVRVHANFAEYVFLALLLMYFLETRTAIGTLIHVFGAVLLAGHALHAIEVSRLEEDVRWRMAGMACTFGVLGAAAVLLLWYALRASML
jgi:uncharacterized protein